MGDLIRLYEIRKPKIEMLLKGETEKVIKLLKSYFLMEILIYGM